MKKHLVVISAGVITGLLMYAFFAYNDELKVDGGYPIHIIVSGLGGVVLAYCIRKLNVLLDQLIPWRTNVGLRLLFGVVLISLVAFSLIWGGINAVSVLSANGAIHFNSHFSPLIKLAILVSIGSIMYQVIYFALHSYYVYTMVHVEEVKAERKQVEYQLRALKSQLSPHFLFNNLNSISSLAYIDVSGAEHFIRKMAALYANILKNYGRQLISLQEELDNVKAYGYLMHARFGESLSLETIISDSILNTSVPPLSIQLLIENAIKHNVISEETPLKIVLSNDMNHICVTNNKTSPRKNVVSHHVGLKNISNRYQLISGRKIEVLDEDAFTVKLPIIP